jgi:hypothetical protein
MDPKLTLLFLLIGAIIGLSHLGDEGRRQSWRPLFNRRWREIVRLRRKF